MEKPLCLITGASGYLGSRMAARFRANGWEVKPLVRRPAPDAIPFELGAPVPVEALRGAEVLVHCAYDFLQLSWQAIRRINVLGTERLLESATAAGVRRIIHISSISAFYDCKSLYGRAKLEAEQVARAAGAIVIRPGLVYGPQAGGVFGRLLGTVEKMRVAPIVGMGSQVQLLLHEDDLTHTVLGLASGQIPWQGGTLTLAHEKGWTMRAILKEIARLKHRRITLVPIPWQCVWLGLRAAEAAGLTPKFRSDSLISLMNQSPDPSFAVRDQHGIKVRPFPQGLAPEA